MLLRSRNRNHVEIIRFVENLLDHRLSIKDVPEEPRESCKRRAIDHLSSFLDQRAPSFLRIILRIYPRIIPYPAQTVSLVSFFLSFLLVLPTSISSFETRANQLNRILRNLSVRFNCTVCKYIAHEKCIYRKSLQNFTYVLSAWRRYTLVNVNRLTEKYVGQVTIG